MLSNNQKTIIRSKRESVCFPIINRSTLWYNRLSSDKQRELSNWYQAWLDAPETGIIPNTPDWINNKTKPEEILL